MESREVTLGGPVHYADFGGEGPPLVMIHGWGGSHLNWMAVGPGLARHSHVYALDFIGHGKTPLAGRRANLAGHLDVIDRFISVVCKEPAILMGNSTGGLLSIFEAARDRDQVAGLVLVDPALPSPRTLKLAVVDLAVNLLLAPGLAEAGIRLNGRRNAEQAARQFMRVVTPHPERIPKEVVDAHIAFTEQRDPREFARSFLATGRSLRWYTGRRKRYYEVVDRARVPGLIVHGELDPLVPLAAAFELHDRRPDWRLEVIPGVGHVPMMEAPGRFVEIVDAWLGEVLDPAAATRPG